jgi:hypothetical protein
LSWNKTRVLEQRTVWPDVLPKHAQFPSLKPTSLDASSPAIPFEPKFWPLIVLAIGADLALSKPNEMTITDELVRKISDEVTQYCVLSFNRNKTLVNIVSELGKALSK